MAKGRKTFYSLIILLVRKLREEVVDLHIWIIFLRSSMLVMIQEAFNKTTSFPEQIHPKYHELIRSILIHTISHNEQNIKLHFLAKTLWNLLIIFTVIIRYYKFWIFFSTCALMGQWYSTTQELYQKYCELASRECTWIKPSYILSMKYSRQIVSNKRFKHTLKQHFVSWLQLFKK